MQLSLQTIALITALPYIALAAPLALSLPTATDAGVVDPQGLENAPESVKTEVLTLLDELNLLQEKRSFSGDESGDAELEKRFFGALVLLFGVLNKTGVLGSVWNSVTKGVAEKAPISNIIGNSIKNAVVAVPQIVSAVKDTGLLNPLLNLISKDKAAEPVAEKAPEKKSFLGLILSTVGGFFGGLFRRDFDDSPQSLNPTRNLMWKLPKKGASNLMWKLPKKGASNLSKREEEAMVELVVDKVKNAGMTEDMVEMGLESPDESPKVLAAALTNNAVSIEELYRNIKEAGLTDQIIQYMTDNENNFAEPIAEFVEMKVEQRNETDNAAASIRIASSRTSIASSEPGAAAHLSASPVSFQPLSSSVFVGDIKLSHVASYSNSTVTGSPLFSSEVASAWSNTVASTTTFADYQLPLDA